jgi:predicted kinase
MTKPFNIVCEDYTVYMTIGPSNCSKSWIANEMYTELFKANVDCRVLSSDDFRRQLTGDYDMDKYHPRMLEVSAQAFNLLYCELRNYISYPVNIKTVIIDSTGLNDQFRTDILNICRDHNYKVVCILFDYKNRQDWFANDGGDKYVITKHVDRLKKHVLSNLRRCDYHKVITITERIDSVNVTYIKNKNNLLVEGNNYTVIGDVHGCVNELEQLISNIKEEHNVPILVGDWIDVKDPMLEKSAHYNERIIDYLLANPQILTVKGNHEENLFKYINKIEHTPQEELDDIEFSSFMENNKYFNSRFLANISPGYRSKFIELYNRSYSSIRGQGFIVTHAPCKSKFLLTSPDRMTNLYYKTEEKCDLINNIYNDKHYNNCWPLHLYGHLTFDKPVKTKYSIGLDTGVGYGNVLTGYNVNSKKFITVKSLLDDSLKQLEHITKFKYPVQDLEVKLDDEDTRKLNSFIRNKVPYISGTMCPADKTESTLEDIKTVLSYYASTGQTQVLIQPKYMGSRAQVEVSSEGYKVFTRNGFKLKQTSELDAAIDVLENSVSDELMTWINSLGSYTSVLFDCELMPWSYLGKGLIQNTFEAYYHSHKLHIETMIKHGFYSDLEGYKSSDDYINKVSLPNKQVNSFNHWKNASNLNNLNTFGLELDKYSSNEAPYFMPFNILKVESENKILYSNSEFNRFNNYELLSLLNTPLHVVNVNDLTEAIKVQNLYSHLEGVVVKPYYNIEGQAPYIKVRNVDYLRLVYGHDYTSILHKFIDKKSIKGKLKVSINEWQLGNTLLEIHSSKFDESNKEYVNTLIRLMFELKKEQGLDPRL